MLNLVLKIPENLEVWQKGFATIAMVIVFYTQTFGVFIDQLIKLVKKITKLTKAIKDWLKL